MNLRLTDRAWEKLWLYIHLAEGEVGGLASVTPQDDGFMMSDCYLIDQRATDVDTMLEPEALSRFLVDYAAAGKDPGELRLWWHSHAREQVFWSMDDEHTIDNFGGELLVALVGNFAGKFLARMDRFEPARETEGWLDVLPPGPPPARDGPAAAAARADLDRCVRVVTRRTNKIWTDAAMPQHHG
jgi:hypothetical protein